MLGHPTAIYFNPAGLALRPGTHVYAEGVLAWRTAEYERPSDAIENVNDPGEAAVGTPAEAVSANAGRAELFNFAGAPFLGVTSDLGVPNLGVGVAVFVPFGGSAKWDGNSDYDGDMTYPGAQEGIARWWSIEGTLQSMYLSIGGAYHIPSARLTLGVAANVVRSKVDTIRARTVVGNDDLVNVSGGVVEGRSLIEVEDTTFSVGVGAIFQATDDVSIGLSYQSQPGFGEMAIDGELTNKFGAAPTTVSQIELRQTLPDVLRLGARIRATDDLELRVSGDFVRWSVFTDQCLVDANLSESDCVLNEDGTVDTANGGAGVIVNVPRDWDNAFGIRAGAVYRLNPTVQLTGSLAYDSNAVPDDRMDPALMDFNKTIASVGGQFSLMNDQLVLMATYSQVFYFSRDIEPRGRDAMGASIGPGGPSRTPDAAGSYSQAIGVLNLAVEYAF